MSASCIYTGQISQLHLTTLPHTNNHLPCSDDVIMVIHISGKMFFIRDESLVLNHRRNIYFERFIKFGTHKTEKTKLACKETMTMKILIILSLLCNIIIMSVYGNKMSDEGAISMAKGLRYTKITHLDLFFEELGLSDHSQ